MQRNYQLSDFEAINPQELNKRIAYHEAGHATAIYLYNKLKQLPPVFFQISLQNDSEWVKDKVLSETNNIAAKVEGGCLIQNLELSFIDSQNYMSVSEKNGYNAALEADIVNLLAGAVAEAHYVSKADDEIINADLLSIDSLKRYGSQSDLKKITEYLNCISSDSQLKKQKVSQLLTHTFEFISHPQTWKAVEAVARFVLSSKKQTISCEEIFTVVDTALA